MSETTSSAQFPWVRNTHGHNKFGRDSPDQVCGTTVRVIFGGFRPHCIDLDAPSSLDLVPAEDPAPYRWPDLTAPQCDLWGSSRQIVRDSALERPTLRAENVPVEHLDGDPSAWAFAFTAAVSGFPEGKRGLYDVYRQSTTGSARRKTGAAAANSQRSIVVAGVSPGARHHLLTPR